MTHWPSPVRPCMPDLARTPPAGQASWSSRPVLFWFHMRLDGSRCWRVDPINRHHIRNFIICHQSPFLRFANVPFGFASLFSCSRKSNLINFLQIEQTATLLILSSCQKICNFCWLSLESISCILLWKLMHGYLHAPIKFSRTYMSSR